MYCALYCIAAYCTAANCTSLHCIAWHCTALQRTVLQCTAAYQWVVAGEGGLVELGSLPADEAVLVHPVEAAVVVVHGVADVENLEQTRADVTGRSQGFFVKLDGVARLMKNNKNCPRFNPLPTQTLLKLYN